MTTTDMTILVVPIVLISIITIVIVRWFLNAFMKQQSALLIKEERKQVLSVRLQSHERIALLLERITPESLVIREQQQNINCLQFHSVLVKSIRKEFEHNLAMQIYLSSEIWDSVENAKEEVLKLINSCASEVSPQSPSIELGQKILERSGGSTKFAIKNSLELIRKNISTLF